MDPRKVEKTDKVKEIYTALNSQIAQKVQSNEIIIAGDYNAKLKIDTNECKQAESRNGKLLRETINNSNLKPVNLEANHGQSKQKKRRRKISDSLHPHYRPNSPQYPDNNRRWRRQPKNQREK